MNVPVERVREQIVAVFKAWGRMKKILQTTADVMVATDLAGVDSHGISMLMDYDQSRIKGKLNLKAKPHVVRENLVTGLIDADAGLGHPAAVMAMELAIEKAQALPGIGVTTVFNSHHFGAAGYYAAMAPQKGVWSASSPARPNDQRRADAREGAGTRDQRDGVRRAGGSGTRLSCSTWRRRRPPPTRSRSTTSTASRSLAGWVLDEHGQADHRRFYSRWTTSSRRSVGRPHPTREARLRWQATRVTVLGVMAQILGGALSGASFSPIRVRTQKPQDPDNIGHFMLALDPKAFRAPGDFEEDLDAMIDVLHETAPIDSSNTYSAKYR